MSLKPLSRRQEIRLLDFLEGKFTDLVRNVRIRSQPTSTMQTIPEFLDATVLILSLILQIPPVQPSASLRTTLLLRLTNEILENVPGYLPEPDVLPTLLDFLDDLDQAWVIVLRGQTWRPHKDEDSDSNEEEEEGVSAEPKTSLLTQTEQTRLRSLLQGASGRFEDWLVENDPQAHGARQMGRPSSASIHPGFGQLFMKALEELDGPEDGMDIDWAVI